MSNEPQLLSLDEGSSTAIAPERAVEWLRTLDETWQHADVPQEKADLLHAIYDRIVVAGSSFLSVRLTPAAYQHGLALALPEKGVMARPTGFNRAGAINIRIPIEESRDRLIAGEIA